MDKVTPPNTSELRILEDQCSIGSGPAIVQETSLFRKNLRLFGESALSSRYKPSLGLDKAVATAQLELAEFVRKQ
jgi:hypothetical protein